MVRLSPISPLAYNSLRKYFSHQETDIPLSTHQLSQSTDESSVDFICSVNCQQYQKEKNTYKCIQAFQFILPAQCKWMKGLQLLVFKLNINELNYTKCNNILENHILHVFDVGEEDFNMQNGWNALILMSCIYCQPLNCLQKSLLPQKQKQQTFVQNRRRKNKMAMSSFVRAFR